MPPASGEVETGYEWTVLLFRRTEKYRSACRGPQDWQIYPSMSRLLEDILVAGTTGAIVLER